MRCCLVLSDDVSRTKMRLKNLIKKIMPPILLKLFNRIRMHELERTIKKVSRRKKGAVIKVGFIVQEASLWNKQEPVFTEMIRRDDFEVRLLVVPRLQWSDLSKFESYENNFFLKKYPDHSLKVLHDDGTVINLKDLSFDYVFFPRPYDIHLPTGLRSTDLVQFTRCCYISYGYSLSDNFNDCNVDNPFFNNIYMEFAESKHIQHLLYQKYQKSCDEGIRHFEYLGYPCLEKYLSMKPREKISTITWTPRWSYDHKHGGSNFVEYKDSFLNFCDKLPKDIRVIFRPHPLMFDELIKTKVISLADREEYLETLGKLNVGMDLESPIDIVLDETDVLITDLSSIITEFLITNKPIIYCKKNIEFNDAARKFEEYMYVTTSWEEVEAHVMQLLRGEDVLKEDRKDFIGREFCEVKNSAKKIVDRIISDYQEK